MVLYTTAAQASKGGTAGIEALIDLAIAESNQAYGNSQIGSSLRLVAAHEVPYNETADIITDLVRLQDKTDGSATAGIVAGGPALSRPGLAQRGLAPLDLGQDAEDRRRKEANLHDGMGFTYRKPERSTDPTRAGATGLEMS